MKFTEDQLEGAVRAWLDRDDNQKKIIRGINSVNQIVSQLALSLAERMQPIKEVAERCLPDFLSAVAAYQRWDLVCRSGWLPNETTPWAIIKLDLSSEQCSEILEHHYEHHWDDTKHYFLKAIQDKNVDSEAKSTFEEALRAHGTGLYRAVPRMLFPEIERLFRPHNTGKTRSTQVDKILQEKLALLTVSELQEHGGFTFSGMNKLTKHLYHQLWDDKPYPEAYTDPVPNRHATIHGLVTYKSARSSFDMLVMCELAFGVISALNTRAD